MLNRRVQVAKRPLLCRESRGREDVMQHVIRAALCAVSLPLAAGAALAQQPQQRPAPAAPAPAQRPQQAPAQAQAAPAQPAAPQQAAPTAPAQPQPVRTEITPHDNWTVTCRDFADKRRACSAVLQVVQQQNNQVLFVWVLGKNNEGKLVSVLQTPTGVTLAPGVEVKLARGATRRATYVNCETNRCEATLDMDDAFIRDASGSESVEATLYSNAGQGVKFTLPFKGFDKALAAVR
jgi:invasion protein IalB